MCLQGQTTSHLTSSRDLMPCMWFLHDSAPPHFCAAVSIILNQQINGFLWEGPCHSLIVSWPHVTGFLFMRPFKEQYICKTYWNLSQWIQIYQQIQNTLGIWEKVRVIWCTAYFECAAYSHMKPILELMVAVLSTAYRNVQLCLVNKDIKTKIF